MTNKEKVLNELNNDLERLSRLLIVRRGITGWDEIPTYEYVTSDGKSFDDDSYFDAFEEAVKYEVEWLNAKA